MPLSLMGLCTWVIETLNWAVEVRCFVFHKGRKFANSHYTVIQQSCTQTRLNSAYFEGLNLDQGTGCTWSFCYWLTLSYSGVKINLLLLDFFKSLLLLLLKKDFYLPVFFTHNRIFSRKGNHEMPQSILYNISY